MASWGNDDGILALRTAHSAGAEERNGGDGWKVLIYIMFRLTCSLQP